MPPFHSRPYVENHSLTFSIGDGFDMVVLWWELSWRWRWNLATTWQNDVAKEWKSVRMASDRFRKMYGTHSRTFENSSENTGPRKLSRVNAVRFWRINVTLNLCFCSNCIFHLNSKISIFWHHIIFIHSLSYFNIWLDIWYIVHDESNPMKSIFSQSISLTLKIVLTPNFFL